MNALDTPRKYEDMRIIFNSIFKYAKASGIITYNPVEMIPFKRAERENRDRLTDKQIKTFLLNLQTPIFDKVRNFAYRAPAKRHSIFVGRGAKKRKK